MSQKPNPKSAAPPAAVDKLRPLPGPAGFPVVGIGASAGGLDVCRKLLHALPAKPDMAFIVVQHLEPTHVSLLAELLAEQTAMPVMEARQGLRVERDHVYVIPPGKTLAVRDDILHLADPEAPHGQRLPIDFLFRSLSETYGPRAIGVILSGTGADGSLGLRVVKQKGGFVIAQDPAEAAYDGMPLSAIATGAVDRILAVAEIPQVLAELRLGSPRAATNGEHVNGDASGQGSDPAPLQAIIDLLRANTAHDFGPYKSGTLRRRIERRIGLAGLAAGNMAGYLLLLQEDAAERGRLAKDLLINVTSFFRDAAVFERLATTIIPELIAGRAPDQPLRIWTVGCSTGEETYSIAMLVFEAMAEAKLSIKLQMFASDVDPDAVASAREGLYPASIAADVSPARLARFFIKQGHAYKISPELRGCVVFTVQDLLSDPPFARLDLVSCRNLLIYLAPEAQAIALLRFALRDRGILLLGSSETIGHVEPHFEVVAKSERIYRRIGRGGLLGLNLAATRSEEARIPLRPGQSQPLAREAVLADLCRKLLLDLHAPAAVLINTRNECLYSLGPTYRYLRVVPGQPTHDLLAMAPDGLRTKLRSAIHQARQEKKRIVVNGGLANHESESRPFSIDVTPVQNEAEALLLIGFVDSPHPVERPGPAASRDDHVRIAELEQELDSSRSELQGAIRSLERAGEEQIAVNEEALSVNEEYQSTNEELLISKEELQSLNEELTALNSQLQETLERQRTTADDLQNVLYSTDIATLFLDTELKIRLFTPTIQSFFNVIPSDIGRPLADFSARAADSGVAGDAKTVLQTLQPIEREIEASAGLWFNRRILPYRTHDNGVEGVVITFTEITQRKLAAKALETAKSQAELANMAKSRFLAAASHDLRQPLQTLALLSGLLAKIVTGERATGLVERLDQALESMSDMLNTLLDINRIEAGTVSADLSDFPIDDLLVRLGREFTYLAEAQKLELHVVHCGLMVRSDPLLLEQMIRNLMSNALKYTERGRILLGCRRRAGRIGIEIWDTGIGMPQDQLNVIFEEYHQIDNAARVKSRGLGLGLSIVRRLGLLLDHPIRVRSHPGKGSVFSIDVPLSPEAMLSRKNDMPVGNGLLTRPIQPPTRIDQVKAKPIVGSEAILVVEDDPELLDLIEILLKEEGYYALSAPDGVTALELVARGKIKPALILADYNLPQGINGLQLATKLRARLQSDVPVIVLTGDISTETLRDIALLHCTQLNKPVKMQDLITIVRRLLPMRPIGPIARAAPRTAPDASFAVPIIYVVDDDLPLREGIKAVLDDDGRTVELYPSCESFLSAYRPDREGCLLVDAYLPGMNGLELLQHLQDWGHSLPAIMMTGNSDVPMAVQAMKAGALDFIEKPITAPDLIAMVERALERAHDSSSLVAWRKTAANQIASLTPRQRQIMRLVLEGLPSKIIAADLGISQRTIENHRAAIMKKTGSKSLPALARLALAAEGGTLIADPMQDRIA